MGFFGKIGDFVSDTASSVGKGFQSLGKKVKKVGKRIGHKIHEGARRTYNFALDHAKQIGYIR